MPDNYLIIHKSVLPDYFEKVLEARRMLESGKVREVSEAVRRVGISRSTYYKYKDYVFEPAETTGGRKAVLELMLDHQLFHRVNDVVDGPELVHYLRMMRICSSVLNDDRRSG